MDLEIGVSLDANDGMALMGLMDVEDSSVPELPSADGANGDANKSPGPGANKRRASSGKSQSSHPPEPKEALLVC